MSLRILAAASMAALAVAQSNTATGFGRFPCSVQNGDGTFSPQQSLCTNPLPTVGAGDASTGFKSDFPNPTGQTTCSRQADAGFFCGIAGAPCTSAANCDNGYCSVPTGATTGTCQGGFGQVCNNDDTLCTGLLYCTSSGSATSPALVVTCGGTGAYCIDAAAPADPEQAQLVYNQFCESDYCNAIGECAARLPNGADCTNDPFGCAVGQNCNAATNLCVPNTTGPSQRARARRSLSNRGLCPASHSACAVAGSKSGFECIDTTSNLEQCGACASAGGVDCTALPGVEAVGCVAGQCEVWSCAEGFSWDAASASCQA